jgi:hypothetical protein
MYAFAGLDQDAQQVSPAEAERAGRPGDVLVDLPMH